VAQLELLHAWLHLYRILIPISCTQYQVQSEMKNFTNNDYSDRPRIMTSQWHASNPVLLVMEEKFICLKVSCCDKNSLYASPPVMSLYIRSLWSAQAFTQPCIILS
jgi:hypothetical protein